MAARGKGAVEPAGAQTDAHPSISGAVRPPKITVINYDQGEMSEAVVTSAEECAAFKHKATVTWINVDGIYDVDLVTRFGQVFGLHSLVVENILDTDQRAKMEDYGEYVYVVLKTLSSGDRRSEVESEQFSIILRQGVLLSFQEREGDVFGPVRDRIRNGKGRIRAMGADYLCYALVDAIVDHYFVICERLGERIEAIQDELIGDPSPRRLRELHDLRRQVLQVRRSLWPLREVVGALARGDARIISEPTEAYLRDVHDHIVQVVDTVETFREALGSMADIYLSSISNRMNEVMKVLTIIATIFIPLTFVAGVYGMNFQHMPELSWRYGYLGVLLVMASVAAVMMLYFKRKGWL
jgi:magnesium transporter